MDKFTFPQDYENEMRAFCVEIAAKTASDWINTSDLIRNAQSIFHYILTGSIPEK
jgi:hypothetical protein